jgi:hypothetical protein
MSASGAATITAMFNLLKAMFDLLKECPSHLISALLWQLAAALLPALQQAAAALTGQQRPGACRATPQKPL